MSLQVLRVARGALSAAALWLLGVAYALILGVWVALAAVVPLAGAWIGAVPAVFVALSVSPTIAGATALAYGPRRSVPSPTGS